LTRQQPPPRNIKLVIEYDGAGYVGWQRQANGISVQERLEGALAIVTQAPVVLRCAGRTDAGVHARGQVANFFTHSQVPLRAFVRGANGLVPRDIAVVSAEEMPLEFDARRSARRKRYRYSVWNRPVRSPAESTTSWHIRAPLDLDKMARAAAQLVGRHDFGAFRAADCERLTTVRVVHECTVGRVGSLVTIDIVATAFLKNMVRIVAGTLVEIGRGVRAANAIERALVTFDREECGVTAPPHGLTLVEVVY
jgi:tRNA pseudouridine38-40 synthase